MWIKFEQMIDPIFYSDLEISYVSSIASVRYTDEELQVVLRKRLRTLQTIDIANDKDFKQMILLLDMAKKLEKSKEIDRAIDVYINILLNYQICGMTYFERPAILLERQKRYASALAVCKLFERAAKAQDKRPNRLGPPIINEVLHRMTRLKKKMGID